MRWIVLEATSVSIHPNKIIFFVLIFFALIP